MEKIRVSIIEPISEYGGLEFYDLGLCESLCSQDVDSILYTCSKMKIHNEFKHRCEVKPVYKDVFNTRNKLIKAFKYMKGTLSSLVDSKRRRVVLVHFHLFHFSSVEFINLLLARMFKFRIVVTVHDIESLDKLVNNSSYKKYRKFSRLIDKIIVHNKVLRREVITKLVGFEKKNIHLVPTTDFDFIYNRDILKSEAREKIAPEIPSSSRIILFFGQIKRTKGLDILIKGFSELLDKDTFLIIAGRCWKTDMESYNSLIDKLNISHRVKLDLRFIQSSDVVHYFKACDVSVLPYTKIYNSSILLRSMEYGAPTVVSDLDMFKSVVRNGETGMIFRSGDWKELGEVITKILENDRLKTSLGKNASEYIRTNYSLKICGEKTKKIYQEVMEM